MQAAQTLPRLARGLTAALALTMLAACTGTFAVDYDEPLTKAVTRNLRVSTINVSVPETLTVSEANVLIPDADIVWHGEPAGDRRAQVAAVIKTAARQAVSPMRGARRATLNIAVSQFHGETPKAVLKAPSAVHSIRFTAQLVDSRTGEQLTRPTAIKADLAALVGDSAIEAQRKSRGAFLSWQKPRLTAHITAVLKGWLGLGPDIRGTFSSLGR